MLLALIFVFVVDGQRLLETLGHPVILVLEELFLRRCVMAWYGLQHCLWRPHEVGWSVGFYCFCGSSDRLGHYYVHA
jgi:hypothetical protein